MANESYVLLLAAFALAAIAIAGCVNVSSQDQLGTVDWTVPQYPSSTSPPVCLPPDSQNPCSCLICQNSTGLPILNYLPFLKGWFGTSLKGGQCEFQQCSPATMDKNLNDKDTLKTNEVRTLMFGSGPSFMSTDSANLYCGYTLQLATKWMKGIGDAPRIQQPGRAMCWLDRNILPLYMYYTAGQHIDPVRTGQIANAFATANNGFLSSGTGTGPVMITTEVDLDSSKPDQVAAVKAQLAAIRSNCPPTQCKTVLAVKLGDPNKPGDPGVSALQQVLGIPGHPTPEYGMVDIVGFGFRANDYPQCDATYAIGQAYVFSRYVLTTYSKPTIWLYAGASEGKSLGATCTWTPQMVQDFYSNLYSASVGMVSSGIIGASLYELTDGTGPLPCDPTQEGCNFGVLNADGTQKHPEINAWSTLCQDYGAQYYRNPIMFSSNGQGATCDILTTGQISENIAYQVNSNQPLPTADVTPMAKQKGFGCGEICVSGAKMTKPDIYDNLGHQITTAHCVAYPVLDQFADDADISQLYYRSIVNIETRGSFDPTLFSCVPNSNQNCNTQGLTMAQICARAGLPSDCGHAVVPTGGPECPSGQKPCAFGLAQCTELPGESDVYTASCGGTSYNPFNPGDSLCCGVNKFSEYLNAARQVIEANWADLSDPTCQNAMKDDEKPWAEYFLASEYYNGGPANSAYSVSAFLNQRDQNGHCTGEQNFVQYLRNKNDYGALVMSSYANSIDTCSSDCPGK